MHKLITYIIGRYLNALNFISKSAGSKASFKIFCTVMPYKLRPFQEEYLAKANYSSITVDGEQVQLYKWGIGTHRILMVHGWKSNSYRWKQYLDNIDFSKHTIYSLDFPAHGRSEGTLWNLIKGNKTLKATIDYIGKVDTFIGHSVGAFTSFYFFHQHPELQPKRMVSLGTAGDVRDFIGEMEQALNINNNTKENLNAYFQTFTGKEVSYFNIENFFNNIQYDALIIHDKDDKDTNYNYSQRLNTLIPNSKLVLTKGLGHKLKDDSVTSLVLDYID